MSADIEFKSSVFTADDLCWNKLPAVEVSLMIFLCLKGFYRDKGPPWECDEFRYLGENVTCLGG